MKPIIKWVGGKTQLLETIRQMLPSGWIRYYEPFLGGGALLLDFDLDITSSAVVNDINPELINMYLQVRDHVDEVIKCLTIMDDIHERSLEPKEYYYKVRKGFNKNLGSNDTEQAARLIYLNKHCFNGLYRVNSKGEFNVPFNGKLTGRSFDPDHLRDVSTKLKLVEFKCGDFAAAVSDARSGDFVFFDSPYDLLNPTSFTDYTKEGFSYEDHVRLSDLFKELTTRGVKCMLTNHDTVLIRDLYKDFTITEVEVSRNINRNGSDRKGKEVIITNY